VVEPERRSKWITHLWPVKVTHSDRVQALQGASGSLPLHKRYVAGEFREAWRELAVPGDAVWLDPVAADASFLTLKTTCLSRNTLELLIVVLHSTRKSREAHIT
jgi:hypothetical protein